MPTGIPLVAALLFAEVAWGQVGPGREQLLGSWQVEDGDNHEAWSLQSEGDTLHVVRTNNGKVTLDINCTPDARECNSTDEGKIAKITMYFDGSALILKEARGSNVTTRTFTSEPKTDTMTIDVNPVTGPGKRLALRLTRHLRAALRWGAPPGHRARLGAFAVWLSLPEWRVLRRG